MTPKVGDIFDDDGIKRTIIEVGHQYDDGLGWQVTLDNDIGYDCYWSEKMKCWQYWHPKDQS